jgi:butyryl-CoA dehydrogenase
VNYDLTAAQKAIRNTMRNVVKEVVEVPETAGAETLKRNIALMAANHYQSLVLGDDIVGCCVGGEELAKACPSTFFSAMSSAAAFGLPVNRFGTENQKKKYLAPIIEGSGFGALAVTETTAGSDVAGIATTARRTDAGWVLNGAKSFVTNAPLAGAFLVLAWTDKEAGREKGLTFFLINRESRGVKISEPVEMMGLKGAQIADLQFTDCEAATETVLGMAGEGGAQLTSIMPRIWISVALLALGIGVSCMEDATLYARSRTAFGKPIGHFEGVGAKLAVMYTLTDLGRLLTHRAAWGMEQEEWESATLAACAKLFASESVNKVADLAMQIHAGHGYVKGSRVERLYRDARAAEIVYGTSEMLRAYIAADSLDKFKPAQDRTAEEQAPAFFFA